jgi:hypothetical protein
MRHTLIAIAVVSLAAGSFGCAARPAGTDTTTQPAAADPAAPTTPAADPASTAEATEAVAPADGELVAGFPNYPGANITGQGNETKAVTGVRETKVKLQTKDPYAKVKAHYQGLINELKGAGWHVARVNEKAGDIEWDLAKGTTTAEVDIEAKFGGIVEISIEREDR